MESITFGIYHFLVLLCMLQSFVLAGVFLFREKFRKKSNTALAISLITTGLGGIGHLSYHTGLMYVYPIFRYLPIYFGLLLPIGLYYCGTYILNPNFRFTRKDYWFIAPFFLTALLKISIFIWYIWQPQAIEPYQDIYQKIWQRLEILTIIYLLGVIINLCLKINKYHRQLFENYANIEGKSLYWLRNQYLVLGVIALIWAYVQIHFLLYQETLWIFRLIWISAFCQLYFFGFFLIFRRNLFEIPTFKSEDDDDSQKPILSDKTDEHYQKLLQLMQNQKLYHDAELNMDTLAEKTALSNGYLSRIINQKEGKNFYDFVNTYRISEVKKNLTNPNFSHYSILGIGLEAGFKSKSTFNAVFKKMTGMTPSAYKKTLN